MNTDRLTSLRGLAAVSVVLFHGLLFFRVGEYGNTQAIPLQWSDSLLALQQLLLMLLNGDAAVLLFFVLSGCVLAMSLERAGPLGPAVLAGYYVRRAFRIYPALWLSVLVGAGSVGLILAGRVPELVTAWNVEAFRHELAWKALIGGALGIDNRLNQPLWSLAVELVYSLLFPLIFLATRRPAAALATLVVALVLLASPLHVWAELNVHMLPFVLGAIIPTLHRRDAPGTGRGGLADIFLALAALTLLLASRRAIDPLGLPKPLFLLAESIGAAGIVYLVLYRRIATGWLDRRWLVHLGEISYSTYVLHFPILFLIGTAAMRFLEPQTILGRPILANAALGLATLAVTLPLAALAHRLIELPGIGLGRRTTRLILTGIWLPRDPDPGMARAMPQRVMGTSPSMDHRASDLTAENRRIAPNGGRASSRQTADTF